MRPCDDHARDIETATQLSQYYFPSFIGPFEIARSLNRQCISFVLVGLHGICGWMKEPRAHPDVDVLVSRHDFARATTGLARKYKNLEPVFEGMRVRLLDRETRAAAIDLFRSNGWYRQVFANSHRVSHGGLRFRIPSGEMALAMRFRGLIDRSRPQEDRYSDAHDFLRTIKVQQSIDLDKLARLCDSAWQNGGYRVLRMVRKYRAGRKCSHSRLCSRSSSP